MTPIPVYHHEGSSYVRVDHLPAEEQALFREWIFRQTRPVMPHERDADGRQTTCAYVWDYTRWLSEYRPAALADPYDT